MNETTLGELLDTRATQFANEIALIDRDRPISWSALAHEVDCIAAGFTQLGLQAGDRVAIWLPNVPAWLAVFFACARIGAIAVSVNTRFRAQEVEDIVGRSGARILVYWPGFHGIDFTGILAACDATQLAELEHVVVYAEDESSDHRSARILGRAAVPYASLLGTPPMRLQRSSRASPCVIFTTSGTTRAPKFVLHTHASVLDHAAAVARNFGYHETATRVLVTAPLCGVFGFCNAMATLSAARPLVMLPTFVPAMAAAAIAQHQVTHTHATDEMIAAWLSAAPAQEFPSMRFVGYAAFSPALADLPKRALDRGLRLVGLYGSSEAQALFARQDEQLAPPERWIAGGRPVTQRCLVRATDPDSRRVLPHGTPGELEFKGPSLMVEYFGDPTATRESFSDDGFFRSGDLGFTKADGRFVFLHRLGDALRIGGFLVSPAEIEAALQEHATIAGAQVVGAETATGLRLVAFVVLEPGASLDEAALQSHCGARIAKFKVPARIVALAAFPVTTSANATKIQKSALREMAHVLMQAPPQA